MRFIAVAAVPSLIGFTPPNAQSQADSDFLAKPINPAQVALVASQIASNPALTTEQAMANVLSSVRNGTAAAFPNGADVKPFGSTGNVQTFIESYNYWDAQISLGITSQILATMEGVHQARAAAETHKSTVDDVIQFIRGMVGNMVRRDIFHQIILCNYGEDIANRLCPTFVLGQIADEPDWAQQASSVATLVSSGFLDPSQYVALDDRLGLPARNPAKAPAPSPEPPKADDKTKPQDAKFASGVERIARIDRDDITNAKEMWRRLAPNPLKHLIDAKKKLPTTDERG